MQILGLPVLEAFKKNHAASRGPLDAWRAAVEREDWKTSHDIKRRYQSADFLADNKVIFNVKGNSYRLVVKVKFLWVGTHAEYDKKRF